jgi:PAS domain S-box-containing protein
MSQLLRVLLVEDQESDAALTVRALEKAGYELEWDRVETEDDLASALKKNTWDVIVSDYRMPQLDAPTALAIVQRSGLDLPFIVVSGTIGEDVAVMMMKAGAQDYLMKGSLVRLGPAVARELAEVANRKKRRLAEAERDRLFNLSLDPFCVAGFDGYLRQVNPAWVRTLGWSKNELLSRPWFEGVHPDDRPEALKVQAGLSVGTPVTDFESRHLCKDKTYRWLSWSAFPLLEDKTIFAVARDVTERKISEESLKHSEERHRQAAAFNQRLVDEVNHHVRNNLAALMSLIHLSRKRSTDVQAFAASIESRVQSLSQVHNLMATTGGREMDLLRIINTLNAVAQQTVPFATHITIDGPPVPLDPMQILPLACTVVELFNNCAKHGAYSTPNGTVLIRWFVSRETPQSPEYVKLHWKESGGPTIKNAITPSLGTELIKGFINYDLGGKCNLTYPPTGVDHTIEFAVTPPRK